MHSIWPWLLVILMLTALGCKKKVVKVDPEYVGQWRTEYDVHDGYNVLTIDDGSKGHYVEYGPMADEEFTELMKTKKDKLYLGTQKTFVIDQAPYLENDTTCAWASFGQTCIVYSAVMELDGKMYYRVESTY